MTEDLRKLYRDARAKEQEGYLADFSTGMPSTIPEPENFYAWYDRTSAEERLEELQRRIDWLAGHICTPGPERVKSTFDVPNLPYWGSWELYEALARCRFLAYGVTGILPNNVLVLTGPPAAKGG